MSERLERQFYTRGTLQVAKELLGKKLVKGDKAGFIVETEAYIGPQDKAAHFYQGKKTERNKVAFKQGGFIYIYLCYGIHWMLNITTDQEKPECVLVRALEPVDEEARKLSERKEGSQLCCNGPGKLTDWMNLNKDFYGEDLVESERLWLEEGKEIEKDRIVSGPRIGIDYAEEWVDKEWRFYVKGNDYVST